MKNLLLAIFVLITSTATMAESDNHKRCMVNCTSSGEMPFVCEQRCAGL